MATTTSAAASKKLYLAAVLCLALVVVAAASTTPGEKVKPMCQVPNNVTACVQQIKDFKVMNEGKLLTPDCCNQLAEQIGCACALRDALLEAKLLDLQKPICVKGSSSE